MELLYKTYGIVLQDRLELSYKVTWLFQKRLLIISKQFRLACHTRALDISLIASAIVENNF